MALRNLIPDADIVEAFTVGTDRSFAKKYLNKGLLTQEEVMHLGSHPGAISHLAEFGTLNNWKKPGLHGFVPKAMLNATEFNPATGAGLKSMALKTEGGSVAKLLSEIPAIAKLL